MRLLSLQRPFLAAAYGICRAGLINAAPRPTQLANLLVQGQRHASVKAQGAYKKKSKGGIPKKLGAKRTGGMLVTLFRSIGLLLPAPVEC